MQCFRVTNKQVLARKTFFRSSEFLKNILDNEKSSYKKHFQKNIYIVCLVMMPQGVHLFQFESTAHYAHSNRQDGLANVTRPCLQSIEKRPRTHAMADQAIRPKNAH